MAKGNKALAEVPQNSAEQLISQAITSGASVEIMEKMFALRERVKAEKAREEFVKALSQFQDDCPVIKKTKQVLNKDGRSVRYTFAPLDAIVSQIKKPLKANGLSYRWETTSGDKKMTATCIVTHTLGHSERSSFEVPVDSEGFMTAPQKVASALTFAKRYSLCNALGIATSDDDTDAVDVEKEATPKSAKAKIIFLLRSLGQKTETKKDVEDAVKKLAKLSLEEKNYGEIVERLEILVQEKQGDVSGNE